MKILILGAGMMGRAIAYDLCKFSNFETIAIADNNNDALQSVLKFLNNNTKSININLDQKKDVKKIFSSFDIVISAVPYRYNYDLAKTAIENKTHFLDLGGNNDTVKKELSLSQLAKEKKVTIIPDCGLAPGMTSVITREIVENMDQINFVKIRVGGLPIDPKPPLNYQIVFSPYGLINEYVEDALILDNGKIIKKKSMTDLEQITFPKPFGCLEAFLTSGGCSTLPYTYRDKIGYLDYKTIRYPGHCEKFKTLLDLGFASKKPTKIGKQNVIPREILANILLKTLPKNEKDVVLLKVSSKGTRNNKKMCLTYTMIDHYDEKKNITSMMRTTSYPVSITAQLIEQNIIKTHGVYCSEKIVPCKPFFKELEKRNIIITKKYT